HARPAAELLPSRGGRRRPPRDGSSSHRSAVRRRLAREDGGFRPGRASAAFPCQTVRAPLTVFVMPDRKPGLSPQNLKAPLQPGAPRPSASSASSTTSTTSEPVASILLVDDHRPNLIALEA